MQLRRQIARQIGGLVGAVALLAGASVWGINAAHQDFGAALRGYQSLRVVYGVGAGVSTAKALLGASRADPARVRAELASASARWQLELASLERSASATESALDGALRSALALFETPPPGTTAAYALRLASMDRILGQVARLASDIRADIERRQVAAERTRRTVILFMVSMGLLIVIAAAAIGIRQYRSVVTPIQQLSAAVRRFTAGDFSQRISPLRYAEFTALSDDFNTMASELDELYRQLEQKVRAKSRELVQSERLASVGYLAAGVAHEINNPLGIITGYAEWSLKQLDEPKSPDIRGIEKTLRIICDEAFRCKEIVQKLLSLSRCGDSAGAGRQRVNLGAVVEEVAEMVKALGEFAGRKLSVSIDSPSDQLHVHAAPGEIKQVLLNLAVNALDAVADGSGHVQIEVCRTEASVRIDVSDNGRGMTPATLERIFEPFYTERRDDTRQRGTGLGLSISHAIIQSHAGAIHAHSDGPGTGSRFTLTLPAA